jgi:hypothetical protein
MALQLIFEGKLVARALVQLDVVLACDGEGLSVSGEGVVGNRVVEEVVNFGAGHAGGRCDRSLALYYRCVRVRTA